jgi:hypothetical protein
VGAKSGLLHGIFEALHDMEKWFDKHIESEERGRELSKEDVARLTEDHQKAGADLKRRVAKETWLISDDFRTRLLALEEALSQRSTHWPEFLETASSSALNSAVDDLRRIARSDLSIGERRFYR